MIVLKIVSILLMLGIAGLLGYFHAKEYIRKMEVERKRKSEKISQED